jgi:hypothetical protein
VQHAYDLSPVQISSDSTESKHAASKTENIYMLPLTPRKTDYCFFQKHEPLEVNTLLRKNCQILTNPMKLDSMYMTKGDTRIRAQHGGIWRYTLWWLFSSIDPLCCTTNVGHSITCKVWNWG